MHTSMKKIPLSIDKAIKINDGKDKMDMNFKRSQQQVYNPANVAGAHSIRSHSLHTTLVESQPHCLTQSQTELGGTNFPRDCLTMDSLTTQMYPGLFLMA